MAKINKQQKWLEDKILVTLNVFAMGVMANEYTSKLLKGFAKRIMEDVDQSREEILEIIKEDRKFVEGLPCGEYRHGCKRTLDWMEKKFR